MPCRILQPGIRTSEKFNRCGWIPQSVYLRLLTIVDDFGRYLANPRLLRNELFPLGDHEGNDVLIETVMAALAELENRGLLVRYEVDAKTYVQLTNWRERARTASRFPAMPQANASTLPANAVTPQANASTLPANAVTPQANDSQMTASPPTPTPTPTPTPAPDAGKGSLSLASAQDLVDGRLGLLNLLTGSAFNPPLVERDWIAARLLEVKNDAAGVDAMLRRQVALWKDDPKMRNLLKPSTLFGANFHDYYGQRQQPVEMRAPGKKATSVDTRDELLAALIATQGAIKKLPPDSVERVRLAGEAREMRHRLQSLPNV